MRRFFKMLAAPFKALYARIDSVGYAKKIGVNIKGKVKIYGSSYRMFSTEPWLITLGDNVYITDGVKFVCHDGGTLILRKYVPDLEITKPIIVGNDVYIGIRSTIMPGVTIGNNCIIGAGAVVTQDVPNNSVAAGIPARVIKSIDEYRVKCEAESLKIGHLTYKKKDKELKKIFNISF